jgi:hypothetical protein
VLAFAAFTALRVYQPRCRPSPPGMGYACDPPAPTHPHLQLALLLALAGVAILLATTAVAALWRESIVWKPPRRRRFRSR